MTLTIRLCRLERRALLRLVAGRLSAAALTRPTARDWLEAAALLALATALIIPLGLAGGFLSWAPQSDLADIARAATIALLIPAFGEELLFRAAIIPRDAPKRARFGWALAGLAAFVAWHPLEAALWLTAARPLFFTPAFLIAAGTLGAACTLSYLRAKSLWPPVAIHWLAVVGWKALGGGPALF